MACVENQCRECRTRWSDNGRSGGCPKCGDGDPISFYADDHLDEPDYDRYEPNASDIEFDMTEDAEGETQWA